MCALVEQSVQYVIDDRDHPGVRPIRYEASRSAAARMWALGAGLQRCLRRDRAFASRQVESGEQGTKTVLAFEGHVLERRRFLEMNPNLDDEGLGTEARWELHFDHLSEHDRVAMDLDEAREDYWAAPHDRDSLGGIRASRRCDEQQGATSTAMAVTPRWSQTRRAYRVARERHLHAAAIPEHRNLRRIAHSDRGCGWGGWPRDSRRVKGRH